MAERTRDKYYANGSTNYISRIVPTDKLEWIMIMLRKFKIGFRIEERRGEGTGKLGSRGETQRRSRGEETRNGGKGLTRVEIYRKIKLR